MRLNDFINPKGGTYGGNAIACAAAVATLDVFQSENLLGNAEARSKQIFSLLSSQLPAICAPKGINVDVRGLGLMVGIEFSGDKVKKGFANAISDAAFKKQDMFLLTTSIYVGFCRSLRLPFHDLRSYSRSQETLRLIPPLNITEEEMAEIAKRLFASVEEVVSKL